MFESRKQQQRARADAMRDMRAEGIETSTACKHPGTRNSRGPIQGGDGRSYVQYWCGECGQDTGRYYYPD